jgi:arginine deiminase
MTPDAPAAFGGPGWQARTLPLHAELGDVWARCGLDSEWRPLRSVLLHRPGPELAVADADAAQMLAVPDVARAAAQHDALAETYRASGVDVHYVEPLEARPNQLFAADLFAMTPSGAIVARPASTVRAGEERWVARRLADLGVPILRSIGGRGTFEGADLMWLDGATALVGRGPRTNDDGVRQVTAVLDDIGVRTVVCEVPMSTMHLMGQLRIVDGDLALAWRGRMPDDAVTVLREIGFDVQFLPEDELVAGHAGNFVVLGPRRIVMPAGNPLTQRFYESLGIECLAVAVDELTKAAGAIGCMSGILERDRAD